MLFYISYKTKSYFFQKQLQLILMQYVRILNSPVPREDVLIARKSAME